MSQRINCHYLLIMPKLIFYSLEVFTSSNDAPAEAAQFSIRSKAHIANSHNDIGKPGTAHHIYKTIIGFFYSKFYFLFIYLIFSNNFFFFFTHKVVTLFSGA